MNRNSISLAAAGALVVLACIVPPRAEAQSLARRLAGVKNGTVRMSFASRDDVCGYGNGISTKRSGDSNSHFGWSSSRQSEDVVYDNDCSEGPARVVARFQDGQLEQEAIEKVVEAMRDLAGHLANIRQSALVLQFLP